MTPRIRTAAALAFLALCLGPAGAVAQIAADPPPQVLIIDQDRLFSETRFGDRVSTTIEAETRTLTQENRRIEAELIAEERELTDLRPTMEPEAFQQLADAFDAKVQQIRSEQDAKGRALQQKADVDRQRFFSEIVPILGQIVQERGASVLLDRREVFLSADRIDITDEAIARINANLGEGPDPAPVEPDGTEGTAGTTDPAQN